MKRILKTVLPLFLVAAICIGGSVALLAAKTNKVTNTFEAIYTGVEIQEPSWEPSASHVYSAGETFAKDPQIYNSGNEEAYVYMSVFIPTVTTGYYSAPNSYYKGAYYEAATNPVHSAYNYTYDGSNWEWLYMDASDYTTVKYNGTSYYGSITYYVYRYPLPSGATTAPLFSQMSFINYDADVENALEDEEKNGNGSGSDVIGKELPVIIQAYAVTTDVVETMSQKGSDEGQYWNYGPALGWDYLSEQLNKEYESEEDKPNFYPLPNNVPASFYFDIYDADGLWVEKVELFSASGEYLNLNALNSCLKKLGYVEQFENEEEMYSSFGGSMVMQGTPIYIYSVGEDYNEHCEIKDDLAKVHVQFYENGEQTSSRTFPFKNGTAITNETIEQKLAEKGVDIEISGIEINETAVNGQDYTLTINLTDGSSDITTDNSTSTS